MLSTLIDQFKSNKGFVAAIVSSVLLYFLFAYALERSDFLLLLTLWIALFGCTYLLIEKSGFHFWLLVGIGVLFRLIFIPSTPTLSQDFYRFIWDGRMLAEGVSPYIVAPAQFISGDISLLPHSLRDHLFIIPNASDLVRGMGSLNASHYSNYPPINQLFFVIAAIFFKNSIIGSVIVLRSIMILADIGILWIGKKLLEALNLPIKNILWYFLNPFIIIELAGNLHFEGVMLFFLLSALYLLHQKRWISAGVLLGISIATKLLPLLFLPLLWKQKLTDRLHNTYSWIGILGLYAVIGVTLLVCFLPFVSSEFIQNFSATLSLWFQTFEFNASIYYVLRWIGFHIVGWNMIATFGKVLALLVFLCIMALAFFRSNESSSRLFTTMLFAVSIYLLFATTVHPWYVATPLLLSLFTSYRFPIIWSCVVFLSYSAYRTPNFEESMAWIALEYFIVIGYGIYEISTKKPFQKLTS